MTPRATRAGLSAYRPTRDQLIAAGIVRPSDSCEPAQICAPPLAQASALAAGFSAPATPAPPASLSPSDVGGARGHFTRKPPCARCGRRDWQRCRLTRGQVICEQCKK